MKLPEDTAGRRVRLSLARKKFENMMSVTDIDELEDASESEVRARLQRKVLDRQRRAVLSEVEALKKYHPY